jgi:epoxyqueuosine reductase
MLPLTSAGIVRKALSLGASLAGVAEAAALRRADVYRMHPLPERLSQAGSVVVLAISHETSQPELDFWDNKKGGTPGNRRLMRLADALGRWLAEGGLEAIHLPYQPARGGIFLKEAAVLAGLGVIGRNNLLITPCFGPRVRLRALLLEAVLTPTGSIVFTPCAACSAPCRTVCPQKAFAGGAYARPPCKIQMKQDEAARSANRAADAVSEAVYIKYCRECELACPVGREP